MEPQSPYAPFIPIAPAVLVESNEQTAVATRDDSIRALFADLLQLLQDRADMSDQWRAAELAELDRVLGQTEKVK
jgi:hypothetical protein